MNPSFVVLLKSIAIIALFALFGWASLPRTQCVGGYLHATDAHQASRQILDENGKGIPCKKESKNGQ